MAFFSKKYNERAIRMERYIMKNKLFFITAFIMIIIIASTELNKSNTAVKETISSETIVQEISGEEVPSDSKSSEENLHWRFYYSDLWVFVIGGTICTVNIIRERRKAKEKLQ